MPWARDLARAQINALPVGPTASERAADTPIVVLEVEDQFRSRVIYWRWHTPHPYDFTARVVLEVARRVATSDLYGWLTPGQVLSPRKNELSSGVGYLRGCRLDDREPRMAETA